MIRVVVVDDHPLYRQALADTVGAAPELNLVGSAGDGATRGDGRHMCSPVHTDS